MITNTYASHENGDRGLRRGYTTGSCGAAAAKAAAILLLNGKEETAVEISLPSGESLTLPVCDWESDGKMARCGVQKDSGDDPDITNGVRVYATVIKIQQGVVIDGGEGIGRVTARGLDQPVGNAAINRIPRQMIKDAVTEVMEQYGYAGGLEIVLCIPNGEDLAKKTFNPKLGIVGGLSVLGTTGIVEPMSEKALLDSIRLEIHMKAVNGCRYVTLTPGNYGQAFLQKDLGLDLNTAVKTSNFIGDSLIAAANAGIAGVLLVGHIGKLVKLAGGITQTHSKYGDCRLELLAAHSALAGAGRGVVRNIMEAVTTERAVEILYAEGILSDVMASLLTKIEQTVESCLNSAMQYGVVIFASRLGLLAQSHTVRELAKHMKG